MCFGWTKHSIVVAMTWKMTLMSRWFSIIGSSPSSCPVNCFRPWHYLILSLLPHFIIWAPGSILFAGFLYYFVAQLSLALLVHLGLLSRVSSAEIRSSAILTVVVC